MPLVIGRLMMTLVLASMLAACGDDEGTGSDAGMDSGAACPPGSACYMALDGGGGGSGGDSGAAPVGATFMCATSCTTPEFMIPPGVLGGADGGMPAIDPAILDAIGGGSICSIIMSCSEGCCTEDNACGARNVGLTGPGCIEQAQPGGPSTECPEVPIVLNNATVATFTGGGPISVPIPGCCRDDGKCGLDLGYLGLGCVERSEAALGTMVTPPDGGTAMFESISCTPGAGGDDAGGGDGG